MRQRADTMAQKRARQRDQPNKQTNNRPNNQPTKQTTKQPNNQTTKPTDQHARTAAHLALLARAGARPLLKVQPPIVQRTARLLERVLGRARRVQKVNLDGAGRVAGCEPLPVWREAHARHCVRTQGGRAVVWSYGQMVRWSDGRMQKERV